MRTEINPVVAVVIVVLVVAAVGWWFYSRTAQAGEQHGARVPEAVMKEFREKGPRPMPPIPMPGGQRGNATVPMGPPPGSAQPK
jgi:hypothetical protein